MVSYAEALFGNYGVNDVPVGVIHGELCWQSGCESCCVILYDSWWAMLSHWLWINVSYAEPWLRIMFCYAEPVIGNQVVSVVPVGVNHGELCEVSGCESCCVIMCQYVWLMVRYAKQVVWNHGVLCCASKCDSCWVMLSQWLWSIVSYAEPVVVNHVMLCWASGCETLWVMLNSVCRNHGV